MRPGRPKDIVDAAKTGAFLVTNLVNIRYLTGVDMSAGVLLILPRSQVLFVDGRYTEIASKNVRKGIAVRSAKTLAQALSSIAECGYESDSVTVSQNRNWKRKYKNTKFVQKTGIIEEFRRSKEPDELRRFRKAQSITQTVMEWIPSQLKPGISERELAWKIETWVRELGAQSTSFESIVAFGTHSSRPHHRPTDRKLKKGNLVQIDCGARYQGYCADQSQVFFTADPTAQQSNVYDAVIQAKHAAEVAVCPGVEAKQLEAIARTTLKTHKLSKYFVHSLGHGVGLEIHEGVNISPGASGVKLLKNEIVTIEPGVYLPGKFGIRLESEVVV